MSTPQISVVMPTYRRLPVLRQVLAAWERQTPGDLPFEVVVVDDGSDDGTREALADWRSHRFTLRVASQDNAGPARARNRALAMATAPLVLFTGDDIEPTPSLLAEHQRAHQTHDDPRVVVLGLTRWPPGAPSSATMRHVDGPGAQQFSYHFLEDGKTYDFRHFYTSNVSIRRSLLDREPSHFAEDFPKAAFEDAELAYRLAAHGARIVYHAAPVAYHHHPYDAPSFFRRQRACGEMAAVLYGKTPQLRRFLGLGALGRARLRAQLSGAQTRRRVATVATRVDDVERRLLSVARYYDPLDPPPIDGLLLQLFHYGFLAGLADARLDPPAARRARAAVIVLDVLPAVRTFFTAIDALGLPDPAADRRALEAWAHGAYPVPGRRALAPSP